MVYVFLCCLVRVFLLVVGLLRQKIIDHSHAHATQCVVAKPQLRTAQHENRTVGLPHGGPYFFLGVEVGFKEHFKAKNAASYPGVTQTSPTEIAFECGDWLDALRMLDFTL